MRCKALFIGTRREHWCSPSAPKPALGSILRRASRALSFAVDAPPAHVVLPWVHRVFSNFKRWSYGTFHGLRDKHIDIYANEFVFRWNRRRHFQSNIDTMLGLGRRIGCITWRDVVGDT
ncbi:MULTISPECIES: transposase [unclassified Rhizobium]|uniref:transposase n=1 Tax=unclassified Rhizobium TaxID=2613769 RepID=UPI00386D9DEA